MIDEDMNWIKFVTVLKKEEYLEQIINEE